MKTNILIITLFAILSFGLNINAQSKIEEVKIKTSAQCDMCKFTIEEAMTYAKGVKKFNLNVESKVLTVSFNTKKTNIEEIKEAVNKVGYDADETKADIKAYEKLPACCKKGGAKLHKDNNE